MQFKKKNDNEYDGFTESLCTALFLSCICMIIELIHFYFIIYIYSFLHSFIFQLPYSSSGSQVDKAYTRSSGCKAGTSWGQDAIPLQGTLTHTHTHNHSHCSNVDTPIYLMCTPLGCGRKQEYLEKNHADTWRTCKLHPDSGSARNLLFHQHKILNRMTLIKNLLM